MSPCRRTASSEATSSAAAPSEIWLASAAVSRPPSAERLSATRASRRSSPGAGPRRAATPATGAISARTARRRSPRARARGWRARTPPSRTRLTPHFSAISSAPRNWLISWSPYRSSPAVRPRAGGPGRARRPMVVGDAIGTRLITSTPPATTRSLDAASTACAAKWTACCDEPHCRSSVVPGTALRQPGREHGDAGDVRRLRRRPGSTQPRITSSTSRRVDAGALQQRREERARRGPPGGRPTSPPLRRPTGVRTAATM